MGLLKDNEWHQFKSAITLSLKSSHWSASFEDQPWFNADRNPGHNQEILVSIMPVQTQVFVSGLPYRDTVVLQLQLGQEWEQFQEWMTNEFPDSARRWSAAINGKAWEDNSWVPTRDQTIRVNMSRLGGGMVPKIGVWIKIGNRQPEYVQVMKKRQNCRADFKRKVDGELGHENWQAVIMKPKVLPASFRKKPDRREDDDFGIWFDNSKKLLEKDVVHVHVLDAETSSVVIDEPEEPPRSILVCMIRHEGSEIHDGEMPQGLRTLGEAIHDAAPPFNWVLTPAEKRMNNQVLNLLCGIVN